MSGITCRVLGLRSLSDRMVWLSRKETWAGDIKANRIRIIAIGLFIVNEILNYRVFHVVDQRFHFASLFLCGLWLLAGVTFSLALRRHWAARTLPFLMPAADVFLLGWLLYVGDGPRSALVSVYFLIVALSALRLNQRIVLATAVMAAFGYLTVADYAWHNHLSTMVPGYHATLVIISLLLTGIVLSHAIGRVYTLLEDAGVGGAS